MADVLVMQSMRDPVWHPWQCDGQQQECDKKGGKKPLHEREVNDTPTKQQGKIRRSFDPALSHHANVLKPPQRNLRGLFCVLIILKNIFLYSVMALH